MQAAFVILRTDRTDNGDESTTVEKIFTLELPVATVTDSWPTKGDVAYHVTLGEVYIRKNANANGVISVLDRNNDPYKVNLKDLSREAVTQAIEAMPAASHVQRQIEDYLSEVNEDDDFDYFACHRTVKVVTAIDRTSSVAELMNKIKELCSCEDEDEDEE